MASSIPSAWTKASSSKVPAHWHTPTGGPTPPHWGAPSSGHHGGGFFSGIEHGLGAVGHGIAKTTANLGREAVGMGPGLAHLGYDAFVYPVESYKHPSERPQPFVTDVKQMGTSTYHTVGGLVHHPLRTIENDPLGVLGIAAMAAGGVGGAAGRLGAAGSVLRTGTDLAGEESTLGKALTRRPIVQRTLTSGEGGEPVHPLAFKSPGAALVQKYIFDGVRQFAIDNPGSALGRLLAPAAQRFYAKVLAEENDRIANQLGTPRSIVEQHGVSQKVGIQKMGAAQRRALGRAQGLSVPKNLALLMHGMGTPAEHVRYLENALERAKAGEKGFGTVADIAKRLRQTKMAVRYLDENGNISDPELARIQADIRLGSQHAEELRFKQGSLTPEGALVRLGKERAEIQHGAQGFQGLSPAEQYVTLQGRLAKATKAERAALEPRIQELHDQLVQLGREVTATGRAYIPHEAPTKNVFPNKSGNVSRSADILRAGQQAENFHTFTGRGMRFANHRTNVPGIVGRNMGKPMRIEQILAEHQRLWNAASETPVRNGVPIMDVRTVPDKMKAIFGAERVEGFTEKELAEADQGEIDKLITELYPKAPTGEHVRYLPRSLVKTAVAQYQPITPVLRATLTVSQLARIRRFGPSYIKWLPQNMGVSLIAQGVKMPANALALYRFYQEATPEEIAALKQAVGGQGYARALEQSGALAKGAAATHTLADFWYHVNDAVWRQLQFWHEARAEGIRTPAQMSRLLADPSSPKYLRIARMADNESIRYSAGKGPVGRWAGLHAPAVVVSYPWLRGATQWSGSLPFQHPGFFGVASQAGKPGQQIVDQQYAAAGGATPPFLERYLPTKYGGFDTGFLNPSETPGALLEALSGRQPYRGSGGILSAAGEATGLSALLELATSRNKYGSDVRYSQAIDDFLNRILPFVHLGKKSKTPALSPSEHERLLQLLGYPFAKINYPNAAAQGARDLTGR